MSSTSNRSFKVLVTGSKGQLGMELQRLYKEGYYKNGMMLFVDRDILDISNWAEVRDYLGRQEIDVLINTAAYTAVDKAEDEPEIAYSTNKDGINVLSHVCEELGIYMLHISTDYVFGGSSDVPYKEDDATSPIGVYGASKKAGEDEMLKSAVNGTIIRTAWLYSAFGNNFVKTMLRLGKERNHVTVVADQYGSPTWARDLAETLLKIVSREDIGLRTGIEIFHYTNEGKCSWCEFARAIMQQSRAVCVVDPIETADYPSTCKRPMYSVLDKSKIKETYGLQIPSWEESLEKMLKDPALRRV